MAVTKDQLLIQITADTQKAAQNIEDVTKSLKRLENQSSQSNDAQQRSAQSLNDAGTMFAKVAGTVYVAEQAFAVFKTVYKATVGEFKSSQDNLQKLANNLALMGEKNVPASMKAFQDLANTIEEMTTVEGDQIIKLAGLGVAMGRTDAQIQELIKASVGLAAITDKDVNSAFDTLVQSYRGVARGLQDVLPQVGKMTEGQLRNGEAVKLASAELYRFAEATVNTYEGQMAQATNRFGEVMKEIGHILSAGFNFDSSAQALNSFVGNVLDVLKSIGPAASATIAFVTTAVTSPLKAIIWTLTQIASAVIDATKMGVTLVLKAIAFLTDEAIKKLSGLLKIGNLLNQSFAEILGIEKIAAAFDRASKPIDDFSVKLLSGITDPFDAASQALKSYDKQVMASIDSQNRARKQSEMELSDLAKQKLEEMARAKKTAEDQLKGANASQIQQIYLKRDADIANLDVIRQKLIAENAYFGVAAANYAAAKKAINEKADMDVDKTVANTFAQIIRGNDDVNITLETYRKTTQEITDLRLQASQREIDDQIELLGVDAERNSLAIKALEDRKKMLGEIAEEEKKSQQGEEFQRAKKAGGEIAQSITTTMQTGTLGMVSGMASGFMSVISAVQGVIDMAQQVVDAVPKLLNSLAGLVNSIVELPLKLAEAIDNVFKSVLNLIKNLIPNLIQMVINIVDTIRTFVREAPREFVKMISRAQDMLLNFVNDLPEIFQEVSQSLVEALPMMTAKVIESSLYTLPKIAIRLVEVIITELPPAIWHGIIEGMGEFARIWKRWMKGDFSGGIKLDVDTQLADQKIKQMTQDASRIFTVTAITDAAKNAENEVKKINDAAKKAGKNMWQAFIDSMVKAWHNFLAAGGAIWMGFREAIGDAVAFFKEKGGAIWMGFREAIGDAVAYFKEKGGAIWMGFRESVGDAVAYFKEKGGAIWNGFTESIGDGVAYFKEKGGAIWMGFRESIGDAAAYFKEKGGSIWNGFKENVGVAFSDFGNAIWQSFVKPLKDFKLPSITLPDLTNFKLPKITLPDTSNFKLPTISLPDPGLQEFRDKFYRLGTDIWNGLFAGLDQFDWGSLIPGGGGGGGEKWWEKKFSTGGYVSGNGFQYFAAGGAPRGTDTIPAMLTPGEFVLKRDAVNRIGLGNLTAMNQGKAVVGNNTNNVTLNLSINTKEKIDENFVRQRIMPAIRDELKRGSLDGRAVVYSGGVRK